MISDFEDAVLRIIERERAGRYSKRNGIVTSWDPNKHLAKVTYQPEGQESGWLPVHTLAAGNGTGHMSGLKIGDQVEVTHQEGEFESGAITTRVHSETDPAPTLQSGEELILTPTGSLIKMAQDGSITITDKGGATIKVDGSKNLTASGLASAKFTHASTGNYVALDANGNITSKITSTAQQHYIGGCPAEGGAFAPIATTGGPSPYAQARYA